MSRYPTDQQIQTIGSAISESSGMLAIDITELSKRTTLSRWTIYNLVNQRKIPYVKVGRRLLFPVREIEKWLHEQTITVVEEG